jgi:chemotaxis signal transduction protein
MTDLIVFKVGDNRYALDIENIQRIIQCNELTDIPNAHELIDGMMSHEDNVIRVLSFRKLIGLPSYEDELSALFKKLKKAHGDWVDALHLSVSTGSKFTKTFNPHMCDLGKWIDSFTSYDDRVSAVLSDLTQKHKMLHLTGAEACDVRQTDANKAQHIVDVEVNNIYNDTMGALDTFVNELSLVSNSLQKLIIYEQNGKVFAIKVDSIEDIAHIDESDIKKNEEEHQANGYLELDGVIDIDSVLINLIKAVNLPK